MTDDAIIEVVRAHKEGKQIQLKGKGSSAEWQDVAHPEWQFGMTDYRVKPEPRKPREWTLIECQGELYSKFDGVFPKYIKVREVIEE